MTFLINIPDGRSSDEELVALYKETNDTKVLAELYQRYMDLVYGVCLKYLRHTEASRDAVMNIFEELVRKLKDHEVDKFRSWLYVLARNHCLMQLRSVKNKPVVELPHDLMQSEEIWHLNGEMEQEEKLKLLMDCLGRLPQEQKASVELFYLQSKSYNEIVEATGYEWNKIRSYIQNGRRNLKICMDGK